MSQKDCNIKQVKYKVKNKKGIKRSFKHIDQIERGHIYALVQEGIYSKEAKSFKNNNIQWAKKRQYYTDKKQKESRDIPTR